MLLGILTPPNLGTSLDNRVSIGPRLWHHQTGSQLARSVATVPGTHRHPAQRGKEVGRPLPATESGPRPAQQRRPPRRPDRYSTCLHNGRATSGATHPSGERGDPSRERERAAAKGRSSDVGPSHPIRCHKLQLMAPRPVCRSRSVSPSPSSVSLPGSGQAGRSALGH